jgi:hypothetical protein
LDADGLAGRQALDGKEHEFGKLPLTPTAATGGGGLHKFFALPDGLLIANTVKLDGLPIDVRGVNGYVVVPPSNHASGNSYAWVQSPADVPLALAPDWLVEWVTSKKAPGTAANRSAGWFRMSLPLDLRTAPGVPAGQRHSSAVALVGAHLGRGEPAVEVERLAVAWAARCEPSMPEDEIKKIVADFANKQYSPLAAQWEAPYPFEQRTLLAFPVQALPEWLGAFVTAEAVTTQTPVDLAAMLCLAVLAAALAKKVEVAVKEDYVEPVNLFTITALPPGNRKSAVFAEVMAPLTDFEENQIKQMKGTVETAKNQLEIKKQRLSKLQTKVANADPGEVQDFAREADVLAQELADTKVKALPRLVASDATAEKLASLLAEQDGKMAVLSPEGDVFELMGGRYGKGGGNFAVFLHGHAGEDLRVDRINRPPEFVKKAALTMGLAVQPDVIQGLADKKGFRGRGLLARFLFAMPKSLVGRRETDPPPMHPRIRETYRQKITSLLHLPTKLNRDGQPDTWRTKLAPAAYQTWLAFSAEIEPRLDGHADLASITDWASKLTGAVARIAGLLHIAANVGRSSPWDIQISRETMDDAIDISRYLIDHARAAFAHMGADPIVEDAKFVLGWLRRDKRLVLSQRDIFEGTKGRLPKVEDLLLPLNLLVSHGYLRERPNVDRAGPGRRPSPVFEVNPAVHSQNSPIPVETVGRTHSANSEICANADIPPASASSEPPLEELDSSSHFSQNSHNSAPASTGLHSSNRANCATRLPSATTTSRCTAPEQSANTAKPVAAGSGKPGPGGPATKLSDDLLKMEQLARATRLAQAAARNIRSKAA